MKEVNMYKCDICGFVSNDCVEVCRACDVAGTTTEEKYAIIEEIEGDEDVSVDECPCHYFVSYTHTTIHGMAFSNTIIALKYPVRTVEDLEILMKVLKKNLDTNLVVVINYQFINEEEYLLSKENKEG